MSKPALTVGVLLAAGAGSRFGRPKVLAADGDWLRRAVEALAVGGCDDVVVVLGATVLDVPAPARPVVAERWADGISASVRAGLAAARGAGRAVLHVVDTPDVGADVVSRVLAAADTAPAGLARACFYGRPGHPVVVGAAHWPALVASMRGDRGARDFLAARPDVVRVECGDLAGGEDIDISPRR